MPGGDTDLDALERDGAIDERTDAADRGGSAVDPAPPAVVAADIDPLMADAPVVDTDPGDAVEPPAREGRRRWWSRLVEWEVAPNGHDANGAEANGHDGFPDGRVDRDDPGAPDSNGAVAVAVAPEVHEPSPPLAVEAPPFDRPEAAPATDVTDLTDLDDPSGEPVALVPPERSRPAWHTVPLTDLPDERDPDLLEAPPVEPARTGDIPRVPVMAAERAALIPEPAREPTWLQRRRTRRPRVRRVTRVVRRIDSWTVFKVALLFWVVAYVILVVAGVLLWSVAVSTGTIDNIESFVKDLLALDTFTFDGQKIFRASWVLGAFMAVAGTGLTVTMAVLYNLFSDLVGGVRVTVLEEEVVQRPPS